MTLWGVLPIEARSVDMHPGGSVSDAATIDALDVAGGPFPFRDFLFAQNGDPRGDAAAVLVAHALAERVPGGAVVRAELLERQARHASLLVLGTPRRRRRGNPSQLARRLALPVLAVPPRARSDMTGARSIVCGVRDRRDTACVAAAGALADALDLQLVVMHVWHDPVAAPASPLAAVPTVRAGTDAAAARAILGDVIARAGRSAPGAACLRVTQGRPAAELCAAAVDEPAALLAVTASRRRPLVSALFGATAHDVVRDAARPVLVCPPQPNAALRLAS